MFPIGFQPRAKVGCSLHTTFARECVFTEKKCESRCKRTKRDTGSLPRTVVVDTQVCTRLHSSRYSLIKRSRAMERYNIIFLIGLIFPPSCHCAVSQQPNVPPWPATYDMRASTLTMACNYTGTLNATHFSRFGIIDVDWSNHKEG